MRSGRLLLPERVGAWIEIRHDGSAWFREVVSEADVEMRVLFLTALRTVVYMTGFLALFVWVSLSLRSLDAGLNWFLPGFWKGAGLGLMMVGAGVVLSCAGLFVVRGHGTPAVFDPPKDFVVLGPYRYVRNPMYLGGLCLMTGFGLFQLSVSILVLALALGLLVHWFVRLVEEPGLEKRFGQSYLDYRRSVNRWLPRW
ncbi:MAG: isoprenylcysteine carboxylmethyltransferase family protein [Acidobacteriota bacterium]